VIEADEYDHLNFDLIPSPQGHGSCSRLDGRCNARLSLKLALEEMVGDGYNYDFIVVDLPSLTSQS